MSRIRFLVVGVLVLSLLLGGAGTALVMAQGPTPSAPPASTTPSAPTTATPTAPSTGAQTPRARTSLVQLFLQSLANRLGISVTNLEQAVINAAKDTVSQAAKQGMISQQQANNLLNRLQNIQPGQNFGLFGFMNRFLFFGQNTPRFGQPPRNRRAVPNPQPFRPGRGFGNNFGFGLGRGTTSLDVLEAVAKSLNMSPADVTNAIAGGKTLADLAKSQNVNTSAVQNAIVNAIKANVDRAVTDGLITQATANAIKSRLDPTKIDLTRPGFGLSGLGVMQGGLTPMMPRMPNGRNMMPNGGGTMPMTPNGGRSNRWY